MRVKTVLVATDLSPAADEAICQADLWASSYGARLVVCSVLERPPDGCETGMKALRRLGTLTRRREIEVAVRYGEPHSEIAAAAEACGAGLIVVGAWGRRLNGLLGSTAAKLVSCARSAVLIARPGRERGVVLAATDLSDPAYPILTAAARWVRRYGGRMTVLYLADLERESREAGQARAANVLAAIGAAGAQLIVGDGAPASILKAMKPTEPELLVLGAAAQRERVGAIAAEEIARRASCSTLILRVRPTYDDRYAA